MCFIFFLTDLVLFYICFRPIHLESFTSLRNIYFRPKHFESFTSFSTPSKPLLLSSISLTLSPFPQLFCCYKLLKRRLNKLIKS